MAILYKIRQLFSTCTMSIFQKMVLHCVNISVTIYSYNISSLLFYFLSAEYPVPFGTGYFPSGAKIGATTGRPYVFFNGARRERACPFPATSFEGACKGEGIFLPVLRFLGITEGCCKDLHSQAEAHNKRLALCHHI